MRITMNKEQVFEIIDNWQMDAGEDFIDYWGSNLNIPNFMFWCLGKGIINMNQFNEWEKDYTNNVHEARDAGCFLVEGCYKPYSIGNLDNWIVGYNIVSQFISESLVYQKRLIDFISDYDVTRKDQITIDETELGKSCLTCKNFYNQICYKHILKISYDEAGTKTCDNHMFNASDLLFDSNDEIVREDDN